MLELSTCVSDGCPACLRYFDSYCSDSTELITIIYVAKCVCTCRMGYVTSKCDRLAYARTVLKFKSVERRGQRAVGQSYMENREQ